MIRNDHTQGQGRGEGRVLGPVGLLKADPGGCPQVLDDRLSPGKLTRLRTSSGFGAIRAWSTLACTAERGVVLGEIAASFGSSPAAEDRHGLRLAGGLVLFLLHRVHLPRARPLPAAEVQNRHHQRPEDHHGGHGEARRDRL